MENLMFWRRDDLDSYASILEIRDYYKNYKSSRKIQDIRAGVNIIIIDDEKFRPFANLKSYGYNIKEVPDLDRISDVESFDIVLCDLMGVGKRFDKALGGASIISEIKKNYPTKFVIAYSGARANSFEANAAREHSDVFIKKDTDIKKWVEQLDDLVEIVSDPYEMWLIARQSLIDDEIELKSIVKLESAYVNSVKNKDKSFSVMKLVLEKIDLGGNGKAIIQGLISSAIYSIVLG